MLSKCKQIDLPKYADHRGSLGFVEEGVGIPFEIKRVYYIYGVPQGKERGAHGHKELRQLIIALAGSFEVGLDDGVSRKAFQLDNPWTGLLVSPMMWRDLRGFSEDAVCLVLASEKYDPDDYIHDYQEFVKMATSRNPR